MLLGLVGVVLGGVGLAALFVLFVCREARLAHERRAARDRMRRRRIERWPSGVR